MIVKFPNLDTLQLALTSGAVPAEIAQKPAVAGFGDEDQLWVETSSRLSAAVQRELKRLGAVVCRSSGADLSSEVSSWLELLPLISEEIQPDALEQAAVLFDVPGGEELSRLVMEMLRLGNDRQSFRWLQEDDGKEGRALLRVVGPPYYSLLRALDQLGGPGVAPQAFIESAPGVWVQLGYRHPLAKSIRPPKGKLLLLRPPRLWMLIDDSPFRDVYEIVEFQLPDGPTRWQDGPLTTRLRVAPRLRPAGSADGAQLWVLRGDAIDELNRFVQNAEDQLLTRLAFAVGTKHDQSIVVLRVRQSKAPSPIVILPAEEYKSYLKLNNLFLPVGHILHPPLRRDIVRKLLAEDVNQITWLAPGADGSFTPETLPDDVFRPLTDWVDYVLDRDREALQAWMQAMQFEFEPFMCEEEQPSRPKKPPADEKSSHPQPDQPSEGAARQTSEMVASEQTDETAGSTAEESQLDPFAAVEKTSPSELQKELAAVEGEFLALPGTLDDAPHQALWPRLADLNARLTRTEDAGICWLNALWESSGPSDEEASRWTAAWFHTEMSGPAHRSSTGVEEKPSWIARLATTTAGTREVKTDDLDRLLRNDEPTLADLRGLAAYIAWSAGRDPRPAPLMQSLQQVQRYLEKHETLLPVRACWLAWFHVAHLLDDELALARARDRLLERLFHNGLRPEQDLPSFLRFAGQPTSQRFRGVGQWMEGLAEKAIPWLARQKVAVTAVGKKPATGAYVDFVFAFGLARLGERDASRRLLKRAQETLQSEKKMAHDYLALAFSRRIEQVLSGDPPVGELFRAEELQRLEQAEAKRREDTANKRSDGGLGPRYVIDCMRNLSRILEPHQRVVPYRSYFQHHAEHEKILAELPDVMDRKVLSERIHHLLHNLPRGADRHEVLVKVLQGALDQSSRINEAFAVDMLDRAVKAYDAGLSNDLTPTALVSRATLLQKALFMAGHFDRAEHVHALVGRFQNMLQSQFRRLLESATDSITIETVDALAGHCLYGLRKLGMQSEIERLLAQMSASILGGRTLEALAAEEKNWSLLRALLRVAGGRYYFGQDDEAESVFQAARAMLFEKHLAPKEQTSLACTYAASLAQAPIAIAQARLAELFDRLEEICDGFSTMEYFSQFQYRLVESVVLAVVSDDFTMGSQTRRWLDEDEYIIRRRIHNDHRKMVDRS